MRRNYYQPDDGRRWSGQRSYRRGGWYGPYRPRGRWRQRHDDAHFRVIVAVLAFVGATALGAVFLALVGMLIEVKSGR